MAARRAVPERTRRPARPALQTAANARAEPTLEREDPDAAASEIARYLGNAYLETIARAAAGGEAASAAGPEWGADASAGDGCLQFSTPPARLQAKLAVAAAGDAVEREADRVADELLRRAAAGASAPGADGSYDGEPVQVSRQTAGAIGGGTALTPEIAARVERMRAGGVPLPARARALFEPLLGVDLGAIRIHTGLGAIQTADALNARAYAIGSDIAFGSGQYRPGTDSGRRLLAHELVHTVQQRGTAPGAAAASSVQCKPSARGRIHAGPASFTITHDIQWHLVTDQILAYGDPTLDLIIDLPSLAGHAKPVSARAVAALSVAILISQGGIKFKDGTGRAFFDQVLKDLQQYVDDYGWDHRYYYAFRIDTLFNYIEPESYQNLRARSSEAAIAEHELFPAAAKIDYAALEKRQELVQERRREQWAESKEATINKLIEKARQQKPRPQDLPDKVFARKVAKDWHLKIWVNRKKTPSHIVRLKERETDAELFQRVRDATAEALFRDADRDKREREKEFPAWAKAKKRAVEEALAEQRRREKGKESFPDGLVLVAERQAARPPPGEDAPASPNTAELTRTSSEGAPPVKVSKATVPLATGGTEAPSYIYLQVWVERGSGKSYQRNTGTVPLPLRPDTNVGELVRYIRTLATHLRQYERPASGQPPSPDRNLETTLPSEQALEAFPALLAPTDLPENGITVSGARNEFHMQLDYEYVYGGGPHKDLYIASKLFSQYIRFYWKVLRVPASLKAPETEGASPDWPHRLSYLYDTLNAPGQRYPDARWENAKRFNAGVDTVWSDDDTDSKMRVKFPQMDETKDKPEDFVVYCETRHKPIGDEGLKRVSSIAYYPVHVKPIMTVAKAAVSIRTQKIELIKQEIAAIRAQPKEELDETYQQVLGAIERIKLEELERLTALETKKPAEGIQAEISYIDGLLPKLSEIQKAREEAERQKIAPSKLLQDRPELLAIHYWLLWEGKDLEDYTNEQKRNRERLAGSAKVAHTFKDDIKADSPHQYNAEAAMISTLTGLVYPLRLIIAEAPDGRKMFPGGIAYAVIDATSPETQDRYHGYSPKADSAGHRKAIQDALDDFGDDATYGEGLIIVRIPGPPPGQPGNAEAGSERTPNPTADAHPGPKFMDTESSPGPLQRVLWALSIIALAAGAFALSLTGAGAPAAMALIGFIAAASGAVVAANNIAKKSRQHKLEANAELALDIVSIISVVPAAIGTKFALQAAALRRTNPAAIPAWAQSVERAQRLLRIHGRTEVGATLYLINEKLEDDINKIELLAKRMGLNEVEKGKLRRQAFGNAAVSGVMMIGGVVAARAGAVVERGPSSFVDDVRLQKQADLLELEGLPRGYRTLQDRNVLDAQGELTPAGRDFVDGIVPGASKRLTPAGTEPPTQQPPIVARPAAEAPRPAGAPETVAPQPSRASAREAAETRAKPVSRAAGAGDVETAAGKGGPKRPRPKQEARAAEESGAGGRAAEAEPEGGTFKGGPKKRPAKREPSSQERRQVSGKKPTGPATGPPSGPLPAPAGVSLRSMEIWQFAGRDVVIIDTPDGPRGFYRRTGMGDLGKKHPGGAQEGDWAPFEGFLGGDFVKPENLGKGSLRRWSTEQNRQISDWLKSLNLPEGKDVGDAWGVIQRSLEDAGAPVRYPLPAREAARPPTPPPEPPRAPEQVPPTGPGSPPRPPGAGGGPGAGGPPGIRPLTPDEAEHLAGSEAILSSRPDYDHTVIVDRNTYRREWQTATKSQGGEPPPHGYWDDNRRAIVVYRPRVNANVVPRTPPTPPSGPGSPVRPGGGSPGGAGSAPSQPDPAQAARDVPARPPSLQSRPPAPSPDVVARPRDLEDPHGRIERSARADRDHYFAREYFPNDVVTRGGVPSPEARYYVEAHLEDGIIEMDFVLRRDDFPGATKGSFHRSGQLRGHEEFGRALEYFRGIHGEAAIKGIKGEWGGGDNLDAFNRAFQEGLRNKLEPSEAVRYAAFRTKTGEWAQTAEFTDVTVQDGTGFDANNQIFNRIVVIFHKPGASGRGSGGGPGPVPPTGGGAPGPASPGRPSSAGAIDAVAAPAFARPSASRAGPGGPSQPPPPSPIPRGPSPPGPPSAAPGGGGGGRRGPSVRALTPREAAGVRPEVGLARTRRGDWAISWITARDLYQAAWRDAAGGQGDPAPPHGFLDRDRRQIVVFKPPTNVNVVARPPARQGPSLAERPDPPRPNLATRGPTRSSGTGSPPRPGRPDVTRRTPTRPYPAQAARDLPAGPRLPPPRPPAPPGRGGGGPGGGGPAGVRPLTPAQAEYFARSEAILSSPREYDHSVIVDQDSYRAAWRARAGPQGGAPPPHGYLDQNRRAIVVYRPPADAQVLRTAPLHLPHETDRPNVRGGLLDWLWRRWRLPKPQLGEQLSSGGDAGKLAYGRPGEIGVFEATMPDGQTVAVKIYPDQGGSGDANQRERFARDLAGAEAASRTRSGPEFHGEVNVGRRRLGYAMERIEGDFAEAATRTKRALTDSERIAERLARARITERTLQDVQLFGMELLDRGYYYNGEIQGLIDFSGRYRPIDFEKIRPLSRDPEIRAEQTRNHQEMVSIEIRDLRKLKEPPEPDLPADLPVPEALRGLGYQRFGGEVIGWGHGVQHTDDRLRAILADPQGERARLEAQGLTLDMAKAWLVAYRHVDGQRHTDIFAARARLLAAIVKLLSR